MSTSKFRAGVDWGSTSFRAYRFDDSGVVVEKVEVPAGITAVGDRNYESVLLDNIGHWLEAGDAILLSGMITSRTGWVETPYLDCPVPLQKLAERSIKKVIGHDITAFFLPGICRQAPADVMRGEELQLYGALHSESQLVLLPGTHSKWAYVRHGVVENFHTIATGELFDLLINKSLIGGLATSEHWEKSSFRKGVESGFSSSTIISQLFAARSGVLLEQLRSDDVHSYLSGLLIGNEIKESGVLYPDREDLLVVGSDALTARYQFAFETLGIAATIETREAAALGFQKLISAC